MYFRCPYHGSSALQEQLESAVKGAERERVNLGAALAAERGRAQALESELYRVKTNAASSLAHMPHSHHISQVCQWQANSSGER